jgi:hypothetical protein
MKQLMSDLEMEQEKCAELAAALNGESVSVIRHGMHLLLHRALSASVAVGMLGVRRCVKMMGILTPAMPVVLQLPRSK